MPPPILPDTPTSPWSTMHCVQVRLRVYNHTDPAAWYEVDTSTSQRMMLQEADTRLAAYQEVRLLGNHNVLLNTMHGATRVKHHKERVQQVLLLVKRTYIAQDVATERKRVQVARKEVEEEHERIFGYVVVEQEQSMTHAVSYKSVRFITSLAEQGLLRFMWSNWLVDGRVTSNKQEVLWSHRVAVSQHGPCKPERNRIFCRCVEA